MKRKKSPLKLISPPVERQDGQRSIPSPEGALDGDKFLTTAGENDRLASKGIFFGDVAVALLTKDVRSGEPAIITDREGYGHMGVYYPAPDGYMRLETDEGAQIFKPSEGKLDGRIVGVLRDGKYILTAFTFRPCH